MKALVFTLRFQDQLLYSRMLGDEDAYDRDITVCYPTTVTLPPSADNDWTSIDVPTFTVDDLKAALASLGYGEAARRTHLGRFVDGEKQLVFSLEARHMPCIGKLRAETTLVDCVPRGELDALRNRVISVLSSSLEELEHHHIRTDKHLLEKLESLLKELRS